VTDLETALVGLEEIAAYLETLWRRQRNLRVRVSRRTVQRHMRRHGLPALRLADGPWLARPSEIEAWWIARQSSTETGRE